MCSQPVRDCLDTRRAGPSKTSSWLHGFHLCRKFQSTPTTTTTKNAQSINDISNGTHKLSHNYYHATVRFSLSGELVDHHSTRIVCCSLVTPPNGSQPQSSLNVLGPTTDGAKFAPIAPFAPIIVWLPNELHTVSVVTIRALIFCMCVTSLIRSISLIVIVCGIS